MLSDPDYRPHYTISVTGQLGQFTLDCQNCGMSQLFGSGTTLQSIDVSAMEHDAVHRKVGPL